MLHQGSSPAEGSSKVTAAAATHLAGWQKTAHTKDTLPQLRQECCIKAQEGSSSQ
jgi:hypothetical protein